MRGAHMVHNRRMLNICGIFRGCRCYGHSRDGQLLCVGDGGGTVYIFNVATGKLLTELQHKRSRMPVRACAFNANTRCAHAAVAHAGSFCCETLTQRPHNAHFHQFFRNVVYVGGESLIWRYDAIDTEALAATSAATVS